MQDYKCRLTFERRAVVFDAFISYSHAADGQLAAALQHGLHRFAKPLFKMRVIRVFRDESTLAMTPQLWPEIEKALRSSRFFILMADPLSAQSEWVKREVACWLEMGPRREDADYLDGGDIVWDKARKDFAWDKTTAIAPLLAGAFQGEEPLYQDLRWAREEVHLSRKHPGFAAALAKLSAAIRGRSLDEIYGEDVREQRRSVGFLWAGITLLMLATIFAGWRWWGELQARHQAIKARDAAEEQTRIAESRRLAAESSSALTKYPQRGLLLAVESVKVEQSLHGIRVAADEQSLREALGFIGDQLATRADWAITTVAISPDNRWLVSGSDDKTARLWDLSAKDPAANPVVLRGHEGPVIAVAISSDTHWTVTGSNDKTARLWDLRARDPAANPVVLRGHEEVVRAVAISPDNRWVVTGSSDKTARLWDLSARDPAANPVVLRGHEEPVYAVAISPDNRWVVTGSSDMTARLWDLSAKDPAANPVVLRGHENAIYAVAISPDNRWLVTGSWDKTARLWDLSAKDPAANPVVLRGHEGPVYAVAISSDNRWVVTVSFDRTARLWNLSTRDPAANPVVLRGHEGKVCAVRISPDNRWLVTASFDKTARLWDLRARDPAANPVVLRGHEGEVYGVAISPDNRWVVTGSSDKTARLWLLQMKDLVRLARITVGRNFSADEWRLYFPSEKYRKTFTDLPCPDERVMPKNN
jgi:WD40 repeat protein